MKEAGSEDARLLTLWPMVYVAWADGELEPPEIAEVRRLASGLPNLDEEARRTLDRWLDPDSPPRARDLSQLLSLLRSHRDHLDSTARQSLVELGLALAKVGGAPEAGEAERRALTQIEEALAYPPAEKTREILLRDRPRAETSATEPAFPLPAMRSFLDGRYAPLRRRIETSLATITLGSAELERDEYRQRVLEGCRILAEQGYGALSFPSEAGGQDDLEAFVVAFETLALGDLSLLVKFGVQFGLWGGSVLNLGSDRQRRELLPRIASLDLPGCFAMSETGHGSNVRDVETTATFDAATDELVVDTPNDAARKDYIGNAALHGQMATVFAQLRIGEETHGVHAVLVPIRDAEGSVLPGVRIEDCGAKIGLNGVDNGRIWFEQVRVPRQSLLGRFASIDRDGVYESPIASPGKRFFTMLGTLVGGRVAVAAAALTAAKKGLTIAVRYALRRRQFGPPGEAETLLLDYRTHQRRLLPRLAKSYVLHFAIADLRRRFVARTEADQQEVEALAAGLKAISSWHTIDTLQTCRECCGGAGYLSVNELGDLRADTDVFATFEGDNVVLLQLVAKGLLGDYKRQLGDLDFAGVLRHLARRARRDLSEKNPIRTRRTASAHLRSVDLQRDALGYRASVLLERVAQRLRSRIRHGTSSHRALIECQNHLVAAAVAHVDVVLFDAAEKAIAVASAELQAILDPVRDLWALATLEDHRGWYLENGYFEAQKARAIRREVEALCLELRPQAGPLVDSFGIPDSLLDAPIASY